MAGILVRPQSWGKAEVATNAKFAPFDGPAHALLEDTRTDWVCDAAHGDGEGTQQSPCGRCRRKSADDVCVYRLVCLWVWSDSGAGFGELHPIADVQ